MRLASKAGGRIACGPDQSQQAVTGRLRLLYPGRAFYRIDRPFAARGVHLLTDGLELSKVDRLDLVGSSDNLRCGELLGEIGLNPRPGGFGAAAQLGEPLQDLRRHGRAGGNQLADDHPLAPGRLADRPDRLLDLLRQQNPGVNRGRQILGGRT